MKLRAPTISSTGGCDFADDTEIWGEPDYWATVLETLGRGAGDCEDFSIAKYVTLKAMGFRRIACG